MAIRVQVNHDFGTTPLLSLVRSSGISEDWVSAWSCAVRLEKRLY